MELTKWEFPLREYKGGQVAGGLHYPFNGALEEETKEHNYVNFYFFLEGTVWIAETKSCDVFNFVI